MNKANGNVETLTGVIPLAFASNTAVGDVAQGAVSSTPCFADHVSQFADDATIGVVHPDELDRTFFHGSSVDVVFTGSQ